MSIDQDFASAIETGDITTAESILKHAPHMANAPDWTPPPLHCAILWNQPSIAILLLDQGADIEARDPDRKTTPLRYAILYARKDLLPILLERGANTRAITESGTTAMELAIEASKGCFEQYNDLPSPSSFKEIIHLLRKHGVE